MISNTKRILLVQVIFLTLFPISSLGQSEYVKKQKIQESLEDFISMISDVNNEEEEEAISPSTIAARFGNVNYFYYKGKEMTLQAFIENYCDSGLQCQIVNHSLNISPNNIKKVSNTHSDQRWSVYGVLKRNYAINIQDTLPDKKISFMILWRGMNKEIGILQIDEALSTPEFVEKNLRMEANNRPPFSARVFVPGMAQLHKGSTFKGISFIALETVAVGGIVAFEGLRSSYKAKINTTHDVQDRQNYIDKTNNMQNLRNGFIAGALAVYAWNVVDGIVAKGKKHMEVGRVTMRFAPFATPEAGGLAMNIQF